MTIPLFIFDALVYGALAVSSLAPILLLALLYRDWKAGKLW